MPNSRYVPPNGNRRTQPQTTNQYPGGRSMPSGPSPPQYRNNDLDLNEQYDNRGLNNPYPTQKRVQIIDHNRQTPSVDYMSGRDSHDSYTPDFNQNQNKSKSYDNKSDSIRGSLQRTNNFNIHEYLYGLSAPDPGKNFD